MSDTHDSPPRLLRPEEVAAIAARADDATPNWRVDPRDQRSIVATLPGGAPPWLVARFQHGVDREGRDDVHANACFAANARQDVPALLAHIALLENLLRDMAGDEGRGLVLRMRRALEKIAADTDGMSGIWNQETNRLAREALKTD